MKKYIFANRQITAIISFLLLITAIANAQFIKLHDFKSIPDGYYPKGTLVYDGTYLYGMTYYGGINNAGTILKIKPDGTGYLKIFDFSTATGSNPRTGSLFYDGSFLYGMTSRGGDSIYSGVIFKIKPDGTEYFKLLDFTGNNGSDPSGSLISDGTFLYGMTSGGGTNGKGIIFKIKPDGSEYSKLLDFIGSNGYRPEGSLIYDGTFLYGMTYFGGAYGSPNGNGVVFKIKPDGTEFTKLLDFGGSNGKYPTGSLIYDGTFLYGMTSWGGTNNDGVIFKIKTDGTEYSKLLDFGDSNGAIPFGSLIYDSTFFYGMTAGGGTNNNGLIFKLKPDGTEYSDLHNFSDTINGRYPMGSLITDGTNLYGMTYYGGTCDSGIVFQFHPEGMGITINNNETNFKVYPNPCIDYLYIECTKTEIIEIDLFNIIGKQACKIIYCKTREISIDISGINKGIYFLQLKTKKGLYYKKIVKE